MTAPDHRPYLLATDLRTAEDVARWLCAYRNSRFCVERRLHDDDCDVRGMSTGDDGVSHNAWGEERRCTCGSTGSRNVARAALGEP